ncbi:MAG: AMP-binding protein, partial [bacterium]|nr:AMP-binding protein [bacterium]
LPIDSRNPDERIKFILADSRAQVLLTQGDMIAEPEDILRRFDFGNVIPIDSKNIYSDIPGNPAVPLQSTDPAYIIYTSGSTGNPKGVMMEHRNVNNLVFGLIRSVYRQYEAGGLSRLCLLSPFFFDASLQNICAALFRGYSLTIVPEHARMDGGQLLDFYIKYRIEGSDGTPTHLGLLVEALKLKESVPKLDVRHFVFGGEILPRPVVETFFRFFPGTSPNITNVYGPTECCINATSFTVHRSNIKTINIIPLDARLHTYRVYTL